MHSPSARDWKLRHSHDMRPRMGSASDCSAWHAESGAAAAAASAQSQSQSCRAAKAQLCREHQRRAPAAAAAPMTHVLAPHFAAVAVRHLAAVLLHGPQPLNGEHVAAAAAGRGATASTGSVPWRLSRPWRHVARAGSADTRFPQLTRSSGCTPPRRTATRATSCSTCEWRRSEARPAAAGGCVVVGGRPDCESALPVGWHRALLK